MGTKRRTGHGIMRKEHYLSTGEAAELLHVSRSTVSRRFDEGLLRGTVNPITGERLISRDSVLSYVKKHKFPIDTSAIAGRRILAASRDGQLRAHLEALCANDDRLTLQIVDNGSDALVECAANAPHLLVVGPRLPDIAGAEVVRSLRRRVPQRGPRILACSTTDRLEAFREAGADAVLVTPLGSEGDVEGVVYRLLAIPRVPASGPVIVQHTRRWPRIPVSLDATVAVYPLREPTRLNTGTARVDDISEGGALLSDIQLSEKTIPAEPFRIRLDIDAHPLHDLRAECRIVRLYCEEALGAGVTFVEISPEDRRKVSGLLHPAGGV
jgi:excisionase family DNA binding protein